MSVKMRIEVEKKIARCAVRCLLSGGFAITVECDGVAELHESVNLTAIINAMFNLDDCTLTVINPKVGRPYGWVKFVFGNDGHDCISDYTTNLEGFLKTALALGDKYAA